MEHPALEALIEAFLMGEAALNQEFCCSVSEFDACERTARLLVEAARCEAAQAPSRAASAPAPATD